MSDQILSGMQTYYDRISPGARISQVTSINAGWESDVYTFIIETGSQTAPLRQELVLRIYQGGSGYSKAATEFNGMHWLHQAGYPVPEVLLIEREASPLGQPFMVMEKVDGRVLWSFMFSQPAPIRQKLISLFCGLLARLHSLDWRSFIPNEKLAEMQQPFFFIDREMERWRYYANQSSDTGFHHIIKWVEQHRSQMGCTHPAIVHLDLHPGNVLIRPDGSPEVIDWTQVEVSDPRFDLAWALLLIDTHEGAQWRPVFQAEYERLLGMPVEHLELFDVVACAKRLFSVYLSMVSGPETLGMRPGAEVIMKQQFPAIRRVYALLQDRSGLAIPEIEQMLT
jgi:aminoglycoside phosphotransferase (APT) family kinase protein